MAELIPDARLIVLGGDNFSAAEPLMAGVRRPPPSVEKAIFVPSALVQKRYCGSMAPLSYTGAVRTCIRR
ncbi:MAG: hypothetical protein Q8S13_00490 [Dehalococcoidia bacterium]|nr:hypothetical protein [Dehalococcoidia bacterium]